jgi:hypothetical protein
VVGAQSLNSTNTNEAVSEEHRAEAESPSQVLRQVPAFDLAALPNQRFDCAKFVFAELMRWLHKDVSHVLRILTPHVVKATPAAL